MRKINRLTPFQVSRIKAPGRYRDGAGLLLQVTPTGSKSWQLRYQRHGRERMMGLGGLDAVSLAEARVRAREARQLLLDGKDPLDVRHQAIALELADAAKAMTFEKCAEAYLAQHASTWRNDVHRKQWRASLDTANEAFGRLDVRAIDTPMVVALLDPIWQATPESASRLRSRIAKVLDWAQARGFREGENPARWTGHLQHLMKAKPKAKHHPAIAFAELPQLMAELRQRPDSHISARALEFTILTAARTNEALGARWDEFDLAAKVWTCPASRTKSHRDHRVPLSPRALAILQALPRDGSFVFPGAKTGRPLSNMSMLELLKGMRPGLTVHGFRSTFSDWAREQTGYPRDVVEMCLAHVIKDKSEAAYRRMDALPKRTRLMLEWGRFCESTPMQAGEVVALHA
jgi:integrase